MKLYLELVWNDFKTFYKKVSTGLLVFTGFISVWFAWAKVFVSGEANYGMAALLGLVFTMVMAMFAWLIVDLVKVILKYHQDVMRRVKEVKTMREWK